MKHVLSALAGFVALAWLPQTWGEEFVLANKTSPSVIVLSGTDSLLRQGAEWMRDFFQRQGYAAEVRSHTGTPAAGGICVILETAESCPTARAEGVAPDVLGFDREDAYLLRPAGTHRLLVLGRTVQGARAGLACLVRSAKETSDQLIAPIPDGVQRPFFKIRELAAANRGLVLQGTSYADTLWRNWDDTRIRAYAEELWLFGFNSIQLCEGRSFRITPETEPKALEAARKMEVFSEAAHQNGMLLTQMIWGQAPFNRKICWSAPETREVMKQEFRWMAKRFGNTVDHVVMHMRDPGGCACGTCDDYRTPQEIAAFVLEEYRKVNPRVSLTLSTWFIPTFWLHAPGPKFLTETSVQFWTGDPNTPFRDRSAVRVLPGGPGTRFLDSTFAPQEIGIALHKWYQPEKANLVRKSGRALDIWSWYMSDQETTTDMSLCMRRVDAYFSTLSGHASEEVQRISTELCFHGWPQVLNAYVAAQKMWQPKRDLREIEREFCAGMFGDENAEAMVHLYEACELVANPTRGDTCLPTLDYVFGNAAFNRQFRDVLREVEGVRLNKTRPARWTTIARPEEMLNYLKRHLRMISTLSDAREKILELQGRGAGPEEIEKIAAAAENQPEFAEELLFPALSKQLRKPVSR